MNVEIVRLRMVTDDPRYVGLIPVIRTLHGYQLLSSHGVVFSLS